MCCLKTPVRAGLPGRRGGGHGLPHRQYGALAAKGANKDIGNAAFAVKKPVLAASAFELTRKVAEDNADWTPERIAARQNLARLASTVWRVAQLSD